MIQVHGPTEYAERKTLMAKQANILGSRQMSRKTAKKRQHRQISRVTGTKQQQKTNILGNSQKDKTDKCPKK